MFATCIENQNLDEYWIIQSTLQGNLDAFNQLVLTYQDMAFNLAYRLIGERSGAEDIVQDAFLSAYLKLGTFRFGSFKSWLLRIVTTACYDELRRWKRRPVVSLSSSGPDPEDPEPILWLQDPGASPEETTLNSELSAAIQKGLLTLNVEYRSVLILVDLLEASYAETAQILDVPIGTVKSRLLRARSRMRYALSGYLNLAQDFYGYVS